MDDFNRYLMRGASPESTESSPIFCFAENPIENRNYAHLSPTNLTYEDEILENDNMTSSLPVDPIGKDKSGYSIEEEIVELESEMEFLGKLSSIISALVVI